MGKFSVIFDMDGTLVDSQKVYIPAWDYAGAEQDFENLGRHLPEVCGMNEAGWKNFLCKKYPTINIDEFVRSMYKYRDLHAKLAFMPAAKELLDFLHKNNVSMAVASGSSTEAVMKNMKALGVYDYFDTFVGGEQVENGKPAPDIFLKAAESLGEDPENCFVVEDSANGILGGYNAGMKCIGVPDIAPFSTEIKKILFAGISNLSEAIPIFERELYL